MQRRQTLVLQAAYQERTGDSERDALGSKDTIAKRYVQAVIGGVLQMVTFLYALILLRFDINCFFMSPLLIGLAFLIGNTTSSLSLTLLFGSIAAVPGLLFYIWLKQGNI